MTYGAVDHPLRMCRVVRLGSLCSFQDVSGSIPQLMVAQQAVYTHSRSIFSNALALPARARVVPKLLIVSTSRTSPSQGEKDVRDEDDVPLAILPL